MTKKLPSKSCLKNLSDKEKYILYALGQSYKSFIKMFSNKPLHVRISKPLFIDLLISSKSVEKKERALYKNLEALEKKKYVRYIDNELGFTKKGLDAFMRMNSEIKGYTDLLAHLYDPRTISLHKKLQTKLKN